MPAWRRQAEPLPVVAGPEVAAEAVAAVSDAPSQAPEPLDAAVEVAGAAAPGAPLRVPAAADGKQVVAAAEAVAPDAPWSAPVPAQTCCVAAEAVVSTALSRSAVADR